MYLLGTHSEVLTRLTVEIRATYSEEKDITVASLSDLALLNAVLEESLRLFPPVSLSSLLYVCKVGTLFNRL